VVGLPFLTIIIATNPESRVKLLGINPILFYSGYEIE
jgi:hypothetical protein